MDFFSVKSLSCWLELPIFLCKRDIFLFGWCISECKTCGKSLRSSCNVRPAVKHIHLNDRKGQVKHCSSHPNGNTFTKQTAFQVAELERLEKVFVLQQQPRSQINFALMFLEVMVWAPQIEKLLCLLLFHLSSGAQIECGQRRDCKIFVLSNIAEQNFEELDIVLVVSVLQLWSKSTRRRMKHEEHYVGQFILAFRNCLIKGSNSFVNFSYHIADGQALLGWD